LFIFSLGAFDIIKLLSKRRCYF